MTNIEAIKYLEYLQDNYTRKGAPMCQAIDTAIAVLNPKPICTNADKIRQMTDEELAERFAPHMLCRICPKTLRIYCTKEDCIKYALKWLKQEVDDVQSD